MGKFTPEQIEALRLAKALGLRYLRLSGRHVFMTASDMEDDFDVEVAPRMIPALACLEQLEISSSTCLDLTTMDLSTPADKSYLTIKVSLMDTDIVKAIMEIVMRMSEDLLVPQHYREEIADTVCWKEAMYE